MANLITITTPQSPSLTLTTQSNPTLSVSTNNNLTLLNTEWGKLVGDINDQTDLQTLLAAINTTITNSVNSINEAISLLQQAIDLKQSLVDKGIANGYASLNSIGKVPQSQLDITFPVVSVNGKTGDVNLSSSDVDLGSVDNTSDLDKPISTATQTALNLKQDSSSAVTLTGIQTLTYKTLTSPVINSPTGLSNGDVNLSAVPNLDTSNPANITQSATYRFVSDTEKTTWNSKQNALGYTPENISNKSATTTLGTSNTLYPTQGAVKTYVDTIAAIKINSSSLATVATSGSYLDLSSRPTIPTNTNQLTNGSGYLVTSNNLSELNAITARTNLGLGTLATQSGTFSGTSSGTNTGDETTATVQSKLGVATTSVSGYLTSTDWNAFNDKQNVLTNPVTGTGASGQITYFNGVNSITSSSGFTFTPTSQLSVNNSVTAASAIARGTNLTPVLTAGANSDVLVGLDINPTFNNGSFSSVSNFATRITGNTRQIGKQEYYTIGTNSGRLSTEIYQDADINNPSSGALYIVPLTGNGRIYFGRSPNKALLNFAGVLSIENMPSFSLNGALIWQGSSFGLNRLNDDMVYYSGAPASGKGAHRFFTNLTNSGYAAPDEVFTIANNGSVSLRVGAATAIPLIVKGAASQTANLQEWRNASETPLSSVKADGSYQPASLADSSATNNSLYYSSTQSKLVYKNSSGTVNLLY